MYIKANKHVRKLDSLRFDDCLLFQLFSWILINILFLDLINPSQKAQLAKTFNIS